MPGEEAIEIAPGELCLSSIAPEIPKSRMKCFLGLAVTNVHFKCNGIWYVKSDDLAMSASLAVVLGNVWIKSFEAPLQTTDISENIP